VAGGVSQGLHLSHSPYFIRRVRISADDPMVTAIKKANWVLHPETGTKGETPEEKMANARTYVVDFPVWSHANKTKDQTTIDELDTYFTYQRLYADHNCSNTVTVKDDEWSCLPQMIHDHWDEYLGITFIPLDGGNYELMLYENARKPSTMNSRLKWELLTSNSCVNWIRRSSVTSMKPLRRSPSSLMRL